MKGGEKEREKERRKVKWRLKLCEWAARDSSNSNHLHHTDRSLLAIYHLAGGGQNKDKQRESQNNIASCFSFLNYRCRPQPPSSSSSPTPRSNLPAKMRSVLQSTVACVAGWGLINGEAMVMEFGKFLYGQQDTRREGCWWVGGWVPELH